MAEMNPLCDCGNPDCSGPAGLSVQHEPGAVLMVVTLGDEEVVIPVDPHMARDIAFTLFQAADRAEGKFAEAVN